MNWHILLERSILNTDKLTLSSRNNNFSFDFVALHFTSTDKIIYKYKLEGFDKEWITSEQGNRSAKYTNIPPGNYLFSVKASCNGETWSEPVVFYTIIYTYKYIHCIYDYPEFQDS